jgi:hypothetical protein
MHSGTRRRPHGWVPGPISWSWPHGSATRLRTVYKPCAHLMPDAHDRGRRATGQFFRRPRDEGSALDVPSDGVD